MDLKSYIRDVPDFPKPGIIFKDITPLLGDPQAFSAMIDAFAERYVNSGITRVCGIESRGFIIGAALALRMNVGFVPIRKAGKLPYKKIRREYSLEYGTDAIEIHADSVARGEKVLLVDDLVATGGTAEAAVALLQDVGAEIVGIAFAVELEFLQGYKKFDPSKYFALLKY
ncbi:MAG: adenine phosphoribosyltransferase [Candidatus Riflebacteria bacterium HGW-Riflebacteria-1]|jgi:adenine phosphoribosyltransferase|nr:MAG: adenine phosphoribosyltransferase [Candidatus Riflebacteria bacterium HGW-Riflebacteria-1]